MVYLVGAGPGNPGLITAKGMELLKKCDALIYDRLGTNELLEVVPDSCVKIYVGKKPGAHYKNQEEINAIMIECASKYQTVVRLKGGDPFVFGRGGEEVIALKTRNIPFQIIPGITSAIAVPELMGIPVTHREVSRSFHVFTGHTKSGDQDSFSHIHKTDGSSIFLMGVSQIQQIVQKLIADGEKLTKPVTVISKGTLPGEKKITGTLGDIAEKIRENNISSPAVILLGDTATYSFVSQDIGPLLGKKIGVVGTRQFRERMRLNIEERGASLYSLCSMEIVETEETKAIEYELEHIGEYGWIAFTSGNSIKIFFEKALHAHFDFRRFAKIKFAVIGSGTRQMLQNYGFEADYYPKHYTTIDLASGLAEHIGKDEKILIPRALKGSGEMLTVLDEKKVNYKILSIYDVCGKRTENWEYLNQFDVITFASASGVHAFANELKKDVDIIEWEKQRKSVLVAAIGDITAKALKQYGIIADIVPSQYDSVSLIDSMEDYYR